MFLKRLELQGFKTFATRTEFIFDSGITAIVGPNGSGKSNIADAVRWVLGEQSPRPLRIKRGEDVIFAGSSTRPRLGMAEVSITLDNSTGWLPVAYNEVTITRRAYRSGETEYLVNKNRVRLRDVVDMLLAGNVGQNSYTVIGQGAIDAALSLRPEERRELFEEAADIKRYQIKRNDALTRLQASEANLVRIRDISAEIEPRLRSLQEQAQRAQEQERLVQELRSYLAAWYVQRWNEASEALRRMLVVESDVAQKLEEAEEAQRSLNEQMADVRRREGELRTRLGEWHRQSSALHSQAEALERRMAVAGATLDATNRQYHETLDELVPLREQAMAQQQRIATDEEALAQRAAEQAERLALQQRLETEAADLDARRRETERQLEAAESTLFRLSTEIVAVEGKLSGLAARRQGIVDEMAQRQRQIEENRQSAETVQRAIAEAQAVLAQHEEAYAAQDRQRSALQTAIASARKEYEAAAAAVRAAHDERRALELRQETLARLQESLAGYDAGVRSVLQAARSGALRGCVGTVASLLRVPPQYEAAISAALGSREQDIVMESWQAAENAVEHLRRNRAGRATFLPLDVIQGRTASEKVEGAIGWAHELVSVPDTYRAVASYLLGRVLIVPDLPAARRALAHPAARSIASIATLAGDIVRPGGAITGGSPTVRSSGLLERERELAELPARIAEARAKEQSCDQAATAAQARLRQAEEQLVALDGRLATLRRSRDEQQGVLAQRRREGERWQQELAWLRRQEQALATDLQKLADEERRLTDTLAVLGRQRAETQQSLEAIRGQIADLAGSALAGRLAEARTAVALGEQALQSLRAIIESAKKEGERITAQITAKEQRAAALASEARSLSGEIETMRADLNRVSASLAALQAEIAPAEAAVAALEKERAALMEQEAAARTRLAELERQRSQAALDVQRARNELAKLQAQIEAEEGLGIKEFGLSEDDVKALLDELAVPVQLSLGVTGGHHAPAPAATAVGADALKRRVDALRAQLRHLGPVNPNAVQEYNEALGRYTFLTSQAEDLEKAVRSLKTVIAELDEIMRQRFETTFEAVGREFRRYFTTLFGGGTARLALTDPDDPSETGIEIIAQPPGKRMQSLALLSGGERALTAAALLFAILTVNPIPFCVLDEVDAALDDANVGRFRDTLKQLAEKTQFLVITHNKGTMEIASTFYGVSMTADSVSQVLSLKLDEALAR